jgi:hypothetical protein
MVLEAFQTDTSSSCFSRLDAGSWATTQAGHVEGTLSWSQEDPLERVKFCERTNFLIRCLYSFAHWQWKGALPSNRAIETRTMVKTACKSSFISSVATVEDELQENGMEEWTDVCNVLSCVCFKP